MKYASYLYYLLYPYLMLLSQYPIHTAYKNMMQTYDFTEYYLVFSTVFLLTGISVFLLYHCYQAIQPRIRYGIELVKPHSFRLVRLQLFQWESASPGILHPSGQ